jgi:hypothetical protein
LSVQISRRRWSCVADPHLCLSEDGAAFIHGLASHAEVWLGPEFLNILDGWPLYDREPELLRPFGDRRPGDRHRGEEQTRQAIRLWLRLRDEAGLGGAKLCWVRDAVRESRLPDGLDESVVPRWEAMAEALDERLSGAEASGPMVAATRDAVALAALLPGAVLLALRDDPDHDEPPALCRHLEDWGVPCRRLDALDDLVAMERGLMLQLLVEAGLAGLIWAGIRLALVHLVVPGRSRLPLGPGFPPHGFGAPDDEVDFLTEMPPRPLRGVWEGARAFWYDLDAENRHGEA